MNIALVGPTYPFRGGISHYTTLLYRELKKKHSVKFFSFSRPYPKFLFPGDASFDKSKKPIKADKVKRILDWACPFSWISVAQKIKKFKPDLVIFPWWMWGWAIPFATIAILAKTFSKTKILFLCHNVIEHETAWWKNLLTKFALSTGNYYIVHSKSDFNKLKHVFPKAKIKKTFHPTYEIFKLRKLTKTAAQKKLGISGNTILFFGYIRPYKGLRYLLQALPLVLKKIDVTLLVAGEFWEDREKYQDLIKQLGITKNVKIFDEYIPNEELGIYFSATDLVLLPYTSATGTGITQIAFGFEKPVIGTKVGDLLEVIENGRRGPVVSPQNSKELAEAIIKCYQENLIEKFSKNIKQDKKLFSWSNLVVAIESFPKNG